MPRVLIVAYGNPLRSDDGVAWHAADVLEGKFSSEEVEILQLHQLTPEVAEEVRSRELVLFLDAACIDDIENACAGGVRVRELLAADSREHNPGQFSHVYSPAKVLALAHALYQARPKAFVITVAGLDFGHGQSLSPEVAAAVPALIARIESLVRGSNGTA